MPNPGSDKVFAGSIPKVYDTHLVPLIFESYAADLARPSSARALSRMLEVAAGTGVVTRAMASSLFASVAIVATDLNQAMLDKAAAVGTERAVEWRQADAMQLPFDDASFDAVVCQFGVMFFPDKARAFSEARRASERDRGARCVASRRGHRRCSRGARGPLRKQCRRRQDPGPRGHDRTHLTRL